jgi:phosphoadenosine phosphosulfate reductase
MSIPDLQTRLAKAEPVEVIRAALEAYGKDCAISFSGAEDVVLLEYARQTGLPFRVFSLDTGRLHAETYRFLEKAAEFFKVRIEYCFPEAAAVERMVRAKGMFSFYRDGHSECCGIRKVEPLRKQLSGLRGWITGQRRDQSPTRSHVNVVDLDAAFKGVGGGELAKFNPLANVSREDLWLTIRALGLPYNELHERGFVSIGCEPCTKAILPSQHEREGRWWWEDATKKECGLHAGNLKPSAEAARIEPADGIVRPAGRGGNA